LLAQEKVLDCLDTAAFQNGERQPASEKAV
jgi:hypothetical protein